MTYEELESRIARGERIGQTIDAHDAVEALVHELRRLETAREGGMESTEQAWEHAGEEYRRQTRT